MKRNKLSYIQNILLPCVVYSAVTGMLTGIVIFVFKAVSSAAVSLSGKAFAAVREQPIYLPLLISAAVVLGLISAFTVKYLGNCRGGGIPTAIAMVRGLIEFRWLRNIFAVFGSAIVTYLGGLPLGIEGPSVQMGTAIGRGTVKLFAKKHAAWDRYIMTGGSCAGFAAATSAPLTGIFFAFEEAHRRFSPMIFMTAASSVVCASATSQLLCTLTDTDPAFFHFTEKSVLPVKYLWAALAVGLICGICAAVFTKAYRYVNEFFSRCVGSLSAYIKIPAVFVAVALIGFVFSDCLGSGHSIVDMMIGKEGIWYMIIVYLCLRAIMLIVANSNGITGGLFVPSLAFGAMIGSVCARGLIAAGLLPEEYYTVMVIIGISAFLSASSRTPISAVTFAVEALSGAFNILPIALGAAASYIFIEAMGVSSFSDTVIETKTEAENAGRDALLIDTHFTVKSGAFVIGKEIRDILWPPTCVVTSVRKAPGSEAHGSLIGEGDVLHLHYRTFDAEYTFKELEALTGEQSADIRTEAHAVSSAHQVPDL